MCWLKAATGRNQILLVLTLLKRKVESLLLFLLWKDILLPISRRKLNLLEFYSIDMRTIKILWEEKPLTLILFLAVVVRMLSVLFSKGYGMHDDHFLVIESAQSWVDNFDYNGWLPSSSEQASGHSWFYCGIHYFLFRGMKAIGILDPQIKMYIVRFLHAMLSLITVFLGYKIAELVSGKSTARMVGILLATYWFMPFLSVRNLVEVACVPFLIIPTWMLLKPSRLPFALHFFLAGIITC